MIGPEQENGNGNSDIFATSNIIVPEEEIIQQDNFPKQE